MNFLVFLIAIIGAILNTRFENLIISRLFISVVLIIVGFLIKNPFLSVALTILLLFSRTFHSSINKDLIKDLKNYLYNKILLNSSTYLMLLFTGGFFLGFALPAIKHYWLGISSFVIITNLLIYIVEYSNLKSFNEKIEKFMENSTDPIEALKEAYKLMMPFKNVNAEDVIKTRLEMVKNYKEKKSEKPKNKD
ncbi:MAG: hypothetical protein ACK4R7_05255 [Fervidobacterium sp.]